LALSASRKARVGRDDSHSSDRAIQYDLVPAIRDVRRAYNPQQSWQQRREEIMGKKGLREQLIGAWRLVSYIESPVDGSPKRFPMGEKAQGIIMYTPDGYMSAQLMTPGRRNFASGDWFKGTPEETAEEASGYIAYSGPFHVDEDRQSLTHSMNVSLFPGWIGQTQPRVVKIDGNRLHLSTASPIKSGGTDVMADLIWERAEANN
jgi:hypothetical protein